MTKPESSPATFEQSLAKLDQIVRELEEGKLGLSDSLARYEEGIKSLRQCHAALQEAERKIELLAGVDVDGNPVTEAFDDAVLSLEEKAEARGRRRSKATSKTPPRSAAASEVNNADDEGIPGGLF